MPDRGHLFTWGRRFISLSQVFGAYDPHAGHLPKGEGDADAVEALRYGFLRLPWIPEKKHVLSNSRISLRTPLR